MEGTELGRLVANHEFLGIIVYLLSFGTILYTAYYLYPRFKFSIENRGDTEVKQANKKAGQNWAIAIAALYIFYDWIYRGEFGLAKDIVVSIKDSSPLCLLVGALSAFCCVLSKKNEDSPFYTTIGTFGAIVIIFSSWDLPFTGSSACMGALGKIGGFALFDQIIMKKQQTKEDLKTKEDPKVKREIGNVKEDLISTIQQEFTKQELSKRHNSLTENDIKQILNKELTKREREMLKSGIPIETYMEQ